MIAIVFGGKSVEHDVSVVTAKQIHNICKQNKECKLIYVDKDNQLNLYTNERFEFDDFKGDSKFFKPIIIRNGYIYIKKLCGYKKYCKLDCAIMCTHGGIGENGKLCAMLECSGVPVSAGDSVSLGIAMDKWLTKMFLKSNNMPYIKGFRITKSDNKNEIDKQIKKSFGYPVIVKACSGGSSIGIKTAQNFDQLTTALDVAFEFDNSAVVEKELQNFTEFNCAVLGDSQKIELSKIDEPIKKSEILSFSDKYLGGGSKQKGSMKNSKRTYPKLEPWLENKIHNLSKQIFSALGFFGVIRIDFMYTPKDKKLYVNEINAIPGSLANYFFANNKIQQELFVDRLIEISKQNFQNIQKMNKNYITKLF